VLVKFVLWGLADSKTTIEELRRYLRDESADTYEEVEGRYFEEELSRLGLAFD
jgi:hypothetical protein